MNLEDIQDYECNEGDLKLIVDFELTDLDFKGKPLAIESIKYKRDKNHNKKLKQSKVNLKNKPKGKSLF